MKITKVLIKSFLGIDRLDLSLEKPITLISGPNCSGKTSLAHALRYVLLNDLCRVEHRKNVKSLLKDDAKTGSVEITVDGSTYQRSAVTGHIVSRDQPPDPHHLALPYLLDHAAFAALDPQARRGLLYKLMEVSLSKAGIMAELEARGHSGALVNRIAPQLISGFPMAHNEVQGIARETKGRWRQVTGDNYGSVKAEAWGAAAPTVDEVAIDRLKNDIQGLESDASMWQTKHGEIIGRREERQRLTERMAQTRRIADGLSVHQSEETRLRHILDDASDELRSLHESLLLAKPSAPSASAEGVTFECPACSTRLHYSASGVRLYDEDERTEKASDDVETRADILRRLEIADSKRKTAERDLTNTARAAARAQAARDSLADMKHPGREDEEESAAEIEVKINSFRSKRSEAVQVLAALEKVRAERDNAASMTTNARLLHKEITALEALAADLAPDGLPAELLAKVMGPINKRLRDSATMTGWPLAVIDTDQIWISGSYSRRPLRFASTSERWRVDAMLTEAIAYLSGLKILVLDGLDILEPAARGQAIAWLAAIAAEHETIIAMATLKEPPKNMPAGIQGVWLE